MISITQGPTFNKHTFSVGYGGLEIRVSPCFGLFYTQISTDTAIPLILLQRFGNPRVPLAGWASFLYFREYPPKYDRLLHCSQGKQTPLCSRVSIWMANYREMHLVIAFHKRHMHRDAFLQLEYSYLRES